MFGKLFKNRALNTGNASRTPGPTILLIKGPSMAPTLEDGEMVLMSPDGPAEDLSDGIWAFNYRGNLFVKRLTMVPDGSVKVSSDNKKHPIFTADPTSASFERLGRIIWAGRIVR